jgi:hypothetical protein
MEINGVFLDVLDRVSPEMNGSLTIQKFNRYSKLAELKLLNWLSGTLSGEQGYPEPYTTQKSSDYLSPFVSTDKKQVENGIAQKPDGYYLWQKAAIIGDRKDELCGEPVIITGVDTPIERLDSAPFDSRSQTHIESLKPSIRKPICKIVGDSILTLPKDLGSILIEFVRYPVYGELKTMIDTVYNNEVVDLENSVNYEWNEYAREPLIFFITQFYGAGTRESNLQQQNSLVGKTATP